MLISLDGQGALYLQLYRALRRAILNGELAPGGRLPASRVAAGELGVSRNVVLLAYDQLRAEGYITGQVGAGTYVASQLPDTLTRAGQERGGDSDTAGAVAAAAPAPRLSAYARRALQRRRSAMPGVAAEPAGTATPGVSTPGMRPAGASRPRYDFRFGDAALDRYGMSDWRRLLSRHADRVFTPDLPVEGYPPLRAVIAEYVYRVRGIACQPRQVIVVNGTQQALDLIARVFLDPGDRVAIEEPHYPGAREVFLAAGAELVTCPVDGEGLDPAMLPEAGAGAGTGVRIAYVTPSHQFPTGAVMPLARRLALLDWARRNDAYLVEDDYDSEYRYEGRPLEAVQALDRGARTLYIGTFSKILFPALRLGFLIVPPVLIEPFVTAKYLADRHTAILSQAVLADFIDEGRFERHLRRMRTRNEIRRTALLRALERHLGDRVSVTGTNAGVHLAAWLRDHDPEAVDRLIAAARERDVGIYPIGPLFYRTPPRAGLLLGYASLTPEAIDEGVARIAGCLRR